MKWIILESESKYSLQQDLEELGNEYNVLDVSLIVNIWHGPGTLPADKARKLYTALVKVE